MCYLFKQSVSRLFLPLPHLFSPFLSISTYTVPHILLFFFFKRSWCLAEMDTERETETMRERQRGRGRDTEREQSGKKRDVSSTGGKTSRCLRLSACYRENYSNFSAAFLTDRYIYMVSTYAVSAPFPHSVLFH